MNSTDALKEAALELEKHVAQAGWDAPIRLFALINTQSALAKNPKIATELPSETVAKAKNDPHLLFSVEQENLPSAESIDEFLGQIMWPDEVDGAALCIERIALPPDAEAELPASEPEAILAINNHPQRQEIRILVAVLRNGEAWNVIRMKNYDTDDMVLSDSTLAPELTRALNATFVP